MKPKLRIVEKIFQNRAEYYPQIDSFEFGWINVSDKCCSTKEDAEFIVKEHKKGKLVKTETPNQINYFYY